ncbi:hypothetical protein F4811DRAFT_163619 [Daldinia bambusicola]|nr:hypothetical protein F4811DRAFT_163619 [Daldinia bambusicola]
MPTTSSSQRFFPNPSAPLRTADAKAELLASLDRITSLHPPVHTCSTSWPFQGFYSGPTSIAFLFFRLHQILPPDLSFSSSYKHQSLLDWAEAYLALGARLSETSPGPDPAHCGIANETLAHLALEAVVRRDEGLVKRLCGFEAGINDEGVGGSDEWLYGRAGYLYFLRLCRSAFFGEEGDEDGNTPTKNSNSGSGGSGSGSGSGSSALRNILNTTIAHTTTRILSSPQPWTWHGKAYLGAAHGAIGIICQVILSQPSAAPKLEPILASLLAAQRPSGNFPSSAGSESDRLVQFCHGGPGFVLSLAPLLAHFPALGPRMRDAVKRATEDIWERGVLTKEPCLCHGVAGNAVAVAVGVGLGTWKEEKKEDREVEERFEHFLSFMSTEGMEKIGWMRRAGREDGSAGLYTGEAGRAWVWGVKVSGGEKVCIGYNDV